MTTHLIWAGLALASVVGLAAASPTSRVLVARVDDPNVYTCDTDAECAALPICKADPACDGGPDHAPRAAVLLVGVGCGPKGLTMVAAEEDEFGTTCTSIEPLWLPSAEAK